MTRNPRAWGESFASSNRFLRISLARLCKTSASSARASVQGLHLRLRRHDRGHDAAALSGMDTRARRGGAWSFRGPFLFVGRQADDGDHRAPQRDVRRESRSVEVSRVKEGYFVETHSGCCPSSRWSRSCGNSTAPRRWRVASGGHREIVIKTLDALGLTEIFRNGRGHGGRRARASRRGSLPRGRAAAGVEPEACPCSRTARRASTRLRLRGCNTSYVPSAGR